MKVIVGSKNPAKVLAVKEAFGLVFPQASIEPTAVDAPSEVPEQPFGVKETKRGAVNRALNSKKLIPEADYWVGLEGGLEEIDDNLWSSSWMCVVDREGAVSTARTCTYLLPPKLQSLLREGVELGEAADRVFDQQNSKQKNGTVGILTDDLIQRHDFYRDALVLALGALHHKQYYGVSS